MNVSFGLPLQRSWDRMVRMLFRPFAIGKWFVLGFAAFLSEYLSHAAGGRYSYHTKTDEPTRHAVHAIVEFLRHPVWGPVILVIVICSALLSIVFLWVTSRGRFIFLDDVVRERAAIVEPWRRFQRHGNSLFVFSFVAYLVLCGALILIAIPLLPAILAIAEGGDWRVLGFATLGATLAIVAPLGLVVSYVFLLLYQFVVPIMYRDDLGVLAAWSRFLGLFRKHPAPFLGYGLVYLVMSVGVFAVVVVAGLATCCIGFALLATPYVGSVILLPIEVLFRGYGPEFLAQFGAEYSVFGPAAPAAPAPPAAG